MATTAISENHKIVSQDEWQRACREFLKKEKELTRLGDEVALQRRELPWTRVEKHYTFDGPNGKLALAELFSDRSQLATYHFMLGPDWEEGCPGCSYLMDHLNMATGHLRARDVALVLVSRAPLARIEAFKKRMDWRFCWVSSGDCDFNRDFCVSFSKAEFESGENLYNFGTQLPYAEENPGLSFFYKDAAGKIVHTYSVYARGLEPLVATYGLLDRAPKGRNEDDLKKPMSWVRHHDKYEPNVVQIGASCCYENEKH